MTADSHIVEHRLRREQREVLESPPDAYLGDAVRRPPQHRAPLEQDVAAIRGVEPADTVEESGFAGAIRADQTEDLALLDREGDAVERDDAAELDSDVADLKQGRRRGGGGRLMHRGQPGASPHGPPPMAATRPGRASDAFLPVVALEPKTL
jgi:hypothetical protein